MWNLRNVHMCPQTKSYVCIYMCMLCVYLITYTHIISCFFLPCKEIPIPQNVADHVHRVGILCPLCPERRRAHVQRLQTHSISEHSAHSGRREEPENRTFQGLRVWKAAAAIYLKWPLTQGLIKLNVLAQKCWWMS